MTWTLGNLVGKNQNYIYRDITVKKLFLIANIALLAGLSQWWCVIVIFYSKSIGWKSCFSEGGAKLLITLQSSLAGRPCSESCAKYFIMI